MVLAVQTVTPADGEWRIKGDRFHKPDEPTDWIPRSNAVPRDPHGCGLVYQQKIDTKQSFLVGGRRAGENVAIGTFRVWQEAFGREEFLLAAESVAMEWLVETSLHAVHAADVQGFFSMTWLEDSAGTLHLASLRPWPRAWFQAFAQGGVDLLKPDLKGTNVLRSGISLVVDHSYVPFRALR